MSIQIEQIGKRQEFHVEDASSWDDFEQICHFFVEHLGARVLSENDGPDARVWEMGINDETVTVVHDDMIGNYFFAEKPEGEPAAKEMAAKLDEQMGIAAEQNAIAEADRVSVA